MDSTSTQAIGLLFDSQAIARQNKAEKKQIDKRRRQVQQQETLNQQADQDESKLNQKRSETKDTLSRRRGVIRAMMRSSSKNKEAEHSRETNASNQKATSSKASHNSKTSQTKKSKKSLKKHKSSHAKTHHSKAAKTQGKKGADKFTELFSLKEAKDLSKTFFNLKMIQQKAKVENWPKLEDSFDIEKDNLIETLFDRKNLVGCKANKEQLAKAKAKAKRLSRMFRRIGMKAFKPVGTNVAKALAAHNHDITNTKSDHDKNIDQSIYATIVDALEINEILQQLGVKAEMVEMGFQNELSQELLDDAEKVFKKNNHQINKVHKNKCLNKSLKILGDVIGALFCWCAMPFIGVPIILAANGLINKWVSELAKEMGIPSYALKSIIVALSVIIAIASWGADAPASVCITAVLFVAGLMGWITDTMGVIATHQLDETKFPEWVTWAGMGVNIGIALLTGGEALLNLLKSIGNAFMTFGTWAAENIGNLLADVADGLPGEMSSLAEGVEGLSAEGNGLGSLGEEGGEVAETTGTAENSGAASEEMSTGESDPTGTPAEAQTAPNSQAAAGSSGGSAQGPSTSSGSANSGGGTSGTPTGTPGTSSGGGAQGGGEASSAAAPSSESSTGSGSPESTSTSTNSASAVEADTSPTTANTAAVRESMQAQQTQTDLAEEGNDAALSPISNSSGAPDANMEAVSDTQAEGSDTRTMQQKMMSFLRKGFTKMLTKLLEMKDSMMGASEDASELASLTKGAQSAAERAEEITQTIQKVMKILERIARWTLLMAQGAQAVVQFEVGQCQDEIGQLLKQAAQLTGETTLLDQYVSTFNMTIKQTRDNEQQYAKDMSEELQLLGSVISTQRRNSNMLMTA